MVKGQCLQPHARKIVICSSSVLQEALELWRPGFISRSTQRVRCLALQAEERKLQAVFFRERDELFSQPGGGGGAPRPAGTEPWRRKFTVKKSKGSVLFISI